MIEECFYIKITFDGYQLKLNYCVDKNIARGGKFATSKDCTYYDILDYLDSIYQQGDLNQPCFQHYNPAIIIE